MTDKTAFDVVVVGAGPVGTALTIDLAMAGIRTLLLERRDADEGPHPGTNLTNARSMEHFRRWGATPHVRAANPVGEEFERDAQFVTRGNGHVLAKVPGAFADAGPLPFAAAAPHFGPQSSVERGLRARLRELPAAEFRFAAEFERFEQDDKHVSVMYSAGGERRTVTTSYLIGADGSSSSVRSQLAIRMEGARKIASGTAWYVKAPGVRELLAQHVGSACFSWFVNADVAGVLLIAQGGDGVFQFMDVPLEHGTDGSDWGLMRSRLWKALGAEVPVEPLEGGEFRINSLVAPSFQEGRVFLAGEAAHHISVFGGFGMNTGISDAAELGWKLTGAIRGWAGAELLESYTAERQPVVRWIRDMTERTSKHLGELCESGMDESGPEGDALRAKIGAAILDDKRQEIVSFGAQFGGAFYDSPIIASDGSCPPPASFGEFTPAASPGARAPHLWLGDGASLFDAVAHEGFTLLQMSADANVASLQQAAHERGVPMRVVTPGDARLPEVYEATMAIIRPDHYVAWRGTDAPEQPLAVIDRIRGAAGPGARR